MKFSLEIIVRDDRVIINLPDNRHLGISPTSSGVVFTPDWNDRHFTWATDKETGNPFFHITDETSGGKIAKDRYGSEEEYLFDTYSSMRAWGTVKPANFVDAEFFWEQDTKEFADALEEVGVIERSDDRFYLSFTRLREYLEYLSNHREELIDYLDRIYNAVSRTEAWESDSRLFFTPQLDRYILQRPDGYVFEMPLADPVNIFEQMRSIRLVDVMWQMDEEAS